jgi:hypothetical protein
MTDSKNVAAILEQIAQCSPADQQTLFREMRKVHLIHEFEEVMSAPAEMILEAVHRAPELTRRMLRGVIADASFRTFVVPAVGKHGWKDVTPEGNFAYDYKLDDGHGPINVQVKLQRSERGAPVVRDGQRFGLQGEVFTTETQKTRNGMDGAAKTRPYRYDEFDILAVSMQPSTRLWDRYMYTLGRWLLADAEYPDQLAKIQPVTMTNSEYWTDDFEVAAAWFRAPDAGKRMQLTATAKTRGSSSKNKDSRTSELF